MKAHDYPIFSGWRPAILVLLLMMVIAVMPVMASDVTVFVTDGNNNAVQKILPDGTVQFVAGFQYFYDVGVDSQGNVYVAEIGNPGIRKISASDGSISTMSTSVSAPVGIAVDSQGNVYVADANFCRAYKISATDGSASVLGNGYNFGPGIWDVAVDSAGNVYVVSGNQLYKIIASTQAVTLVGTYDTYGIGSVAVDQQDNVYITCFDSGSVLKISNTGVPATMGSGFSSPIGLDVDSESNIYVGDFGTNSIKKISAADGSITTLAGGFNWPYGIAVFEEKGAIPTPEFPTMVLPAVLIIGMLGTVLLIRRTREN